MTLTFRYKDGSPDETVETSEAKFYAYDGCHKFYMLEDVEDFMEALEIGYDVRRIECLRKDWRNSCSLRFIHTWQLHKSYLPQFVKNVKITGQAKFRYPMFNEVVDLKVEGIETDLISRIMFLNEDNEYSYIFILTENEIFKKDEEDHVVLAYGRIPTSCLRNFDLKYYLNFLYEYKGQFGKCIRTSHYYEEKPDEGVHKLYDELKTNEILLEDISKAVSDRYITCVEQIYGKL